MIRTYHLRFISLRLISLIVLVSLTLPITLYADGMSFRINAVDVKPLDGGPSHEIRSWVQLLDAKGLPVRSLDKSHFTLFEDGKPVEILSVEPANEPIGIVLVIDTSGSMGKANKSGALAIDAVKDSILKLKDSLGQDDEIALIVFHTQVETLLDFDYDHNKVANAIKQMKAEGGTCLYDGVYQGIEKAAQRPEGRRAVLVLTDGFDEISGNPCSKHTLDEVVARANKDGKQVPIYTVALQAFTGNVASKEMTRMAEESGGVAAIAPNLDAISQLFVAAAEHLKSQYVLTYKSTAGPGVHQLAAKATEANGFADSPAVSFVIEEAQGRSPILQITNLAQGQELKAKTAIDVKIQSDCAISEIKIYIDDTPVNTLTQDTRDLNIELDPADYQAGAHSLKIVAKGCQNLPGESTLEFRVGQAVAASQSPITSGATIAANTPVISTPQPSLPVAPVVASGNPMDWLKKNLWAPIAVLGLLLAVVVAVVMSKRNSKPVAPSTPWGPNVPHEEYQSGTFSKEIGSSKTGSTSATSLADDDRTSMTQDVPRVVANLVVQESLDLAAGKTFELEARNYRIGRSTESNDIVIPDKPVSRNHALLQVQKGEFVIKDIGSTYGTQINNKPAPAGGIRLMDGDTIRLGTRTVLVFRDLRPKRPDWDTTQDVSAGGGTATSDYDAGTDQTQAINRG